MPCQSPRPFVIEMVHSDSSCPLCDRRARPYRVIEAVDYFECRSCDFLFADPRLLARIDRGEMVREYDADYWASELSAARERSYGSSLARVAEALLYCRLPVTRFVDIGAGPGFLLDALSTYLPAARDTFYGVEKFPPTSERRTSHPHYLIGDLRDVGMQFECGVCIEVLEHLTPTMARQLAAAMKAACIPGSLILFNTGLTHYVRDEDPGYLDPHARGHITSWSVVAARKVFGPEGFVVTALPGKSWAFVVEYQPATLGDEREMAARIWRPIPENLRLMTDPEMGNVMFILGRESARAY